MSFPHSTESPGSSPCLAEDASMLPPSGTTGPLSEPHVYQVPPPTYWTATAGQWLTTTGPSPAETWAGEPDNTGEWVLCPGKDQVPDADYAPHLRRKRKEEPKSRQDCQSEMPRYPPQKNRRRRGQGTQGDLGELSTVLVELVLALALLVVECVK